MKINWTSAAWMSVLVAIFTISARAGQPEPDPGKLMLQSGAIQTINNFGEKFPVQMSADELAAGHYYRIFQFNRALTISEKRTLELSGIKFISYIPYYAFMVSVPVQWNPEAFTTIPFRTMEEITPAIRTDIRIVGGDFPEYAEVKKGSVDIMLEYFSDLQGPSCRASLEASGAQIISSYPAYHQFHVRISKSHALDLAGLYCVKFMAATAPASTPDDTRGRSLHRSNVINSDFISGRHYNGSGTAISLADDGEVGPHIDFQGRLTNILSSGPGGTHGDMTSGIAVGAGNLDPTIRGMADGANIYVHDINAGADGYDHIYNAPSFFSQYGTTIASTSYSQGCNDYDIYSSTGDQITHDNPWFLFVFSAGNNAFGDCGYGAGSPWGTITGGFKQGKNVIACANLDAHEVLDNSSSQGPSQDGRVKPDISANGADQLSTDEGNTYQVGGGTSAACPGIAGVSAQLYQAYKEMNSGVNPEGALIKACLLNGAEDIGNPGPDFNYGWGRVNALRAIQTLEDHRYLLDSAVQGSSQSFPITVPAGTNQVRVMLYWLDKEGDPAATYALVNDLDLQVSDPSLVTYNPWILDPTPTVSALTSNAVRGADHLNNMEQVTIDNPVAGTYSVQVQGTLIPSGTQRFYLVWEFRGPDITLTYPNGGEGFNPGETELLRWDAFGNSGTFNLEYSVDNGSVWSNIATNINNNVRQYDWTVPSVISDRTLVRLTRGLETDENDQPFAILGVPDNLQLDFVCLDTLQISWTAVPGAGAYEVSVLGPKYMDSTLTVTGTTAQLAISQAADTWLSVRAVGANGGKGRRAVAIHKLPGVMNCSFTDDLNLLSAVSPTAGNLFGCQNLTAIPVTVEIRNDGANPASNFPVSYSINGGSMVTETYTGTILHGASVLFTFSSTVDFSTPGTYQMDINTGLSGDLNPTNNNLNYSVVTIPNANVPFTEDFQAPSFPPTGWTIESSNTQYIWSQKVGITGSDGNPTTAAWFDNYSYIGQGSEDYLISIMTDLGGTGGPQLTFDVAYHQYGSTYNDGLRVDVSTDCGATFQPTGYLKIGADLATGPISASDWEPLLASDWRNDSVSLMPYLNSKIEVRFVNINDYGNNIYVDNVNIINNPVLSTPETESPFCVSVYPNPSSGIFHITTGKLPDSGAILEIFDMQGQKIYSRKLNTGGDNFKGEVDLGNVGKGVYAATLRTNGKNLSFRLTVL